MSAYCLVSKAAVLGACMALGGTAMANPFVISHYDSDGSFLSEFEVTDRDMYVQHIMVDERENIWLSRASTSHSRDVDYPQDVVAKYDIHGTQLAEFDGSDMQSPNGLTLDSQGHLYVTGQNAQFVNSIYKFSPDGDFLQKIAISGWGASDNWNDLTAQGDRLFVSAWGSCSECIAEFTPSGDTVDSFFGTGTSSFARDLAMGETGTLWVYNPPNGGGSTYVREFTLEGDAANAFSTNNYALYPEGLEVDAQGNIVTLDRSVGSLLSFTPGGEPVSVVQLEGVAESAWITDFTFMPDGSLLVAREGSSGAGCNSQGSAPSSQAAWSALLILTSLGLRRRYSN